MNQLIFRFLFSIGVVDRRKRRQSRIQKAVRRNTIIEWLRSPIRFPTGTRTKVFHEEFHFQSFQINNPPPHLKGKNNEQRDNWRQRGTSV